MKRTVKFISAVLAIVLMVSGTACALATSTPETKTLYYNGIIFTNDKANPSAEALVVEDGKFTFVGAYEEAIAFAGDGCAQVDLKGQFVSPSFFDAHIHPVGAAILGVFDFRDYLFVDKPAISEYTTVLKQYLDEHPDITSLRAGGWENASFEGASPAKEILDAVNSEIPIALRSLDGHSLWANSKAIELAGITPETKVPGGEGTIELNDKGEVGGAFRELAAIELVMSKFPPISVDDYKTTILKSQDIFLSAGITGILDPMVATDSSLYQAYRELADNGELKLHVSLAFTVNPQNYKAELEWVIEEIAKYKDSPDQKLKITTCKFFADGALEGGTAYLMDDYASQPGYRGIAIWEKDKMADAFKICDENGITIHVHAIGDAAVSMSLDCMEGLSTDHRNAICHMQLVNEADYARFRDMGVVAVVAPFWAFSGEESEESVNRFLGPDRADEIYPIKSFIDNQVVTASHSDYPASPLCFPLLGIEIATTRIRPEAFKAYVSTDFPPLNLKEAITPEQAIALCTYTGAYANFMEDITGSIEVGKSADFAVIDQNILETPASLATVMETYFAGERVFAK